jgi:hypothetical protein
MRQRGSRSEVKAACACAAIATTTSESAQKKRSALSAPETTREENMNAPSRAIVSDRNYANTMQRSARTAKDRTKRHRKNALRGELADVLE